MVILLSVAGLLLISFLLFGIASDPRTAASAMAMITAKKKNKERINREPLVSVSNHRNPADKRSNGRSTFGTDGEVDDAEAWDDQDLSAPLLSSGSAVIGDGIGTYLGGSSTISDALGDDDTLVDQAEGRGSTVACDRADSTPHTSNLEGHRGDRGGTMGGRGEERMPLTSQWRQQHGADFIPGSAAPAVLRWKKLGYCVHGQGQSSGSEMVILKDVAGFAGPEEREQYNDPARRRSLPRTGNHFFSDIETRGTEGQPSSSSLASGTPSISTITGILGPSGAGKSSLLDLLAGRKCQGEGHSTGSVTLTFHGSSSAGNGCARGRGAGTDGGVEDVRKLGGYVPQEDVLPDTLTCYEHLMFHARLRMRTVQEGGGSSGADFDERVNRVLWVLEELGLKRVADSRIGDGLSGGERRRLSIAAELVARPALLFLDEPTTGLGEMKTEAKGRKAGRNKIHLAEVKPLTNTDNEKVRIVKGFMEKRNYTISTPHEAAIPHTLRLSDSEAYRECWIDVVIYSNRHDVQSHGEYSCAVRRSHVSPRTLCADTPTH